MYYMNYVCIVTYFFLFFLNASEFECNIFYLNFIFGILFFILVFGTCSYFILIITGVDNSIKSSLADYFFRINFSHLKYDYFRAY